jgi:hypothetical protein
MPSSPETVLRPIALFNEFAGDQSAGQHNLLSSAARGEMEEGHSRQIQASRLDEYLKLLA